MKISVESVSYFYKKPTFALEDLTYTFESNSTTAICGPNGSGKSTLLKTLGGVLSPNDGSISYDSKKLSALSKQEIAKNVAYLPSVIIPAFPLSVFDFVSQGRFAHQTLFSSNTPADVEIVNKAIEEVGMSSDIDKPISHLSLGQFQLVLFARAFAQDPKVYLLDESFSNLDLNHQSLIWNLLRKRKDISIIFVTHDLNFSAAHSDNLIWLNHGTIVSSGKTSETFTEKNIREIYPNHSIASHSYSIDKNPQTGKPMIFWL